MRTTALALFLVACGGSTPAPRGAAAAIDALRARAAAHPNDPGAARDLAVGEMLSDGGEAARARPAIDRALRLSPADPTLELLSGIEHEAHARPADALSALGRAVSGAVASRDPSAPSLAEVALDRLAQLYEVAPGWRAATVPLAEAIVADRSQVGPVRDRALSLLLADAFRRGDLDAAHRLADAGGCVRTWRVAGPFGPFALLGFDEPSAAEGAGPLADSYDLGPGRGVRPTRSVVSNGCWTSFGSGTPAGPGGHVGEAFVDLPAAGDYVLRVETPKTLEVRIDGTVALRVDRRAAPTPEVSYTRLHLPGGRREIEVEIATRLQIRA